MRHDTGVAALQFLRPAGSATKGHSSAGNIPLHTSLPELVSWPVSIGRWFLPGPGIAPESHHWVVVGSAHVSLLSFPQKLAIQPRFQEFRHYADGQSNERQIENWCTYALLVRTRRSVAQNARNNTLLPTPA